VKTALFAAMVAMAAFSGGAFAAMNGSNLNGIGLNLAGLNGTGLNLAGLNGSALNTPAILDLNSLRVMHAAVKH
jgi:hypothetical protein